MITTSAHLAELRKRLIVSFGAIFLFAGLSYIFAEQIARFFMAPLFHASPTLLKLIYTNLTEAFITYLKLSLLMGVIFSIPVLIYQLWMFIAAGLYTHERKYVQIAVPFSTVLFVTGALFFLFFVAPWTLRFFILFNQRALGVNSNFTFSDYISFITMLMLIFGIAFQTPIAIFILTRTGLVSIQNFTRSRKFVIVGIFIISAIVTPPDVVSQVTLAIPLYALFELGILLSWLAERKRKKALPVT